MEVEQREESQRAEDWYFQRGVEISVVDIDSEVHDPV